jgi:hypothetical protein
LLDIIAFLRYRKLGKEGLIMGAARINFPRSDVVKEFRATAHKALDDWLDEVEECSFGLFLSGSGPNQYVYPAGPRESVSLPMVYVDSSRPHFVEGFTKNTFTAMIEGIREKAPEAGIIERESFDRGFATCTGRRNRMASFAIRSSRPLPRDKALNQPFARGITMGETGRRLSYSRPQKHTILRGHPSGTDSEDGVESQGKLCRSRTASKCPGS